MLRVATAHDFILSTDAVDVGIRKTVSVAEQLQSGFEQYTALPEDELIVEQFRCD